LEQVLAMPKNTLVMQSGGNTAVFNRSLFGVVDEALGRDGSGKVYGAVHGLEGLLADELLDLGTYSAARWQAIARTPGAALGSTRRKLDSEDVSAVLRVLSSRGIGQIHVIGGNDSAATGHALHLEALKAGVPLKVVNVPKTIDNDLVGTDHTPGYGSAARFVALATKGAGRDAESTGSAAPITVLEVMGRDAGWLAASSALARQEERDAPHVICLPEVPVDDQRFAGLMEEAYRKHGFAVAVVAENARGVDGPLGTDTEPWYTDEFGHPYYEGAGHHLAALLGRRLNVRVRYEKPGTIQRSMAACVSTADAREAEMAGRAAVRAALGGETDIMVTLVRSEGDVYECGTGLVPLSEVANAVKRMLPEYLDPDRYGVTEAFLDYARPLLGAPLPQFGRV
jgi:6-phosphofructokinase